MIKYITTILSLFIFCFSFMREREISISSNCLEIQKTDIAQCIDIIIDNDFAYQPLGQLSFTEKELTESIFKGVYHQKCESGTGIGDVNTSHSYSFYTDNHKNEYMFVKLYKKDAYVLEYVEIKSNNTPIRIKKGEQLIGINYTKKKIAEIFKMKKNNICDCFQIVDDEKNHNHFLYFENNLLKKIVLQQQIN